MTDFFLSLYEFFKNRRVLRLLLLIIICGSLLFFARKISLEEDISGFMPKDKNSERVNFVYKNISISDKIIVRFSLRDTSHTNKDSLIDAAELFASHFDSLTQGKGYIKSVFYKIDQQQIFDITRFLTENAPYFLADTDYNRIDTLLTPEKIKAVLDNNKKILVSPAGMILKNSLVADPLHLSSGILKRLKDFQVSTQYENYNDYIFSKSGTSLLFFISSANPASETAKNEKLVECLEKSISFVQSKTNTKITYFGAAPVAVTNAQQIKKDSWISIIIAVILILSILLWFFRSIKTILMIAVPVAFGALLSLAALYLIKGSISAIAIGAGSVIFGIAINYSLHFLIHARHEDPYNVIKEIASPMLIGSITTVGAFLSLLFISAESMRDFGLFAAFSLTGTLLFVLIFMPHLMGKKNHSTQEKSSFFERFFDKRFERNRLVLLAVSALTVIFLFFSSGVSFETEMNKINYMKPDQRKAFEELSNFTTVGKKSIYLVSDGKNLEQALRGFEKAKISVDSLRVSGDITGVAGIGAFLPSDSMQKIKIERWNNFWKTRKDNVKKMLLEQGKVVGYKENSFHTFFNQLDKDYTVQPTSHFSLITENFVKEYLIVREERAMVVAILYTTPQKSDSVAKRLTHENTFVFDSGSIAKSLINALSGDFNKVLYFCGILVFLFLTISLGRLELGIISFLPMLMSWIWILGIMSIFDIHFNIVNIILATFIFGLGDDYTIFMMDGLMNEYAFRRKLLSSYKTAVALSAITMFIGIGTLVFAEHPAMRSLANVTIIGMTSVVIISYVIPSLLFNYLTLKKGEKRLIPITIRGLAASIYSFTFFLFGSLFLTLSGFFLLGLRNSSNKNKLRYHKILRMVARFVVDHLPLVKTRIINTYGETFEKPGVIICNHQSHLDLMFIMMLSPKIIILTNEWVWKSPFYGRLIRYADYLPVADGIESMIHKLSPLVEKGYSIVVFPEGTRSEDCSIRRFHQGAFFLAENLHLDIIPVLVHGIGHALPKKEFLLRRGMVSVSILQRITPEDTRYGENYSKRKKLVRQMYQEEYNKLALDSEAPSYYSNLVRHNYIYKGASVEKQAKRLLKKYNDFQQLISVLPSQGKMLNPECGMGVFALMCSLVKKDLQIVATDKDLDKIELASNCASRPERLEFICIDNEQIALNEFNFAVFINPSDFNTLQQYTSHNISTYIMIEKTCINYDKFITFEGCKSIFENTEYSILVYSHE